MAEPSSSPSPSSPAPIAEIELGPGKLDQFLDNHQKKLVAAAILVALGVIAYVIYDGLAEAEAQDAGSALLSAEKAGDYQDVIKSWPESNAAASAHPLLAELQWADSQPDSMATLEEFINNYPEHPSIATAKTSLGLRLLDQGKTSEATEILTEVADNDSYIAPLACITLGDIAKAAGKTADATQWYQKAQGDPTEQGNAYANIAASRLTLVNATPPVKIKPTLPKPPAPDTTSTPLTPPLLVKPDAPAPSAPTPPSAPAEPTTNPTPPKAPAPIPAPIPAPKAPKAPQTPQKPANAVPEKTN